MSLEHVWKMHEPMSPVFEKLHLLGLPFAATVHEFTAPDTGEPHDHPFDFTTYILHGSYVERVFKRNGTFKDFHRKAGSVHKVVASTIHQLIELPDGPCYTIMVSGVHYRKSGFWRFTDGVAEFREWDQPFKNE